jgi:hypothetical protein
MDPSAFLDESDWMSSEVSDLDTDDENKQHAHQLLVAQAAGIPVEQVEDQVIWEVVRPVWRAQAVSYTSDNTVTAVPFVVVHRYQLFMNS